MNDDDGPKKSEGAPAWIVTFSDLMTLLLTFFVLLLSNAELDAKKYQLMVQSLHNAFHGENLVGKPLAQVVIQNTNMELGSKSDTPPEEEGDQSDPQAKAEEAAAAAEAQEKSQEVYDKLLEDISDEVYEGILSMERLNDKIVIRYPASATFKAGSDNLSDQILPSLQKISKILNDQNARVTISGHTDDVPIRSGRFRSNWDLSSARAVSVAHQLISIDPANEQRISVEGLAHSKPLVPNDNAENRAKNRRIELTLNMPSGSSTTLKSAENWEVTTEEDSTAN